MSSFFQINEEVEKLKALKLEMGGDASPATAPGKFVLKTAKGTRDFQPEQMAVHEKVLEVVVKVIVVNVSGVVLALTGTDWWKVFSLRRLPSCCESKLLT